MAIERIRNACLQLSTPDPTGKFSLIYSVCGTRQLLTMADLLQPHKQLQFIHNQARTSKYLPQALLLSIQHSHPWLTPPSGPGQLPGPSVGSSVSQLTYHPIDHLTTHCSAQRHRRLQGAVYSPCGAGPKAPAPLHTHCALSPQLV